MIKEKDFYYKKDRMGQLRGFCATVQNGNSIKEASRTTGVEAATISRQISALERDINIALFDRSKHTKLLLTPEGKMFYDDAVVKLQGIDSLFMNYAKIVEEKRRNTLRIASFDMVLEKLVPFVVEFNKKYPDLKTSLFNITKEESFEKLKSKELDLVLYPSDFDEDCPVEFKKDKVSAYNSYWLIYKGHPLEFKDEKDIVREEVATYNFGVLSEEVHVKSYKYFIEEFNLKQPIFIKNGTMGFLKEMVKNKVCISIINEIYVTEEDRKNFVLKDTCNCFTEKFQYSYTLKNTNHKPIAEEFLNILKTNHKKIFC